MLKKVIFFSLSASVVLANSAEFDEIIVTATGFESKLSDEVRNAYVMGENEIGEHGYRSLKEALVKIPGVNIIESSIGDKLDMRGQGESANAAVKVLIDGVPVNMIDGAHGTVPFDMIAIEDVERIEAMPGGGAVLYGGGTRGGVVNIITKKTPKEPYANFGSTMGSYKYYDAKLNVGGNVSDNLFLKLGTKAFKSDGYRDDYKQNGYYLSGALNWQITEDQRLILTPSYYKNKLNTVGSLSMAQVLQDRRQNATPGVTTDVNHKRKEITLDYQNKINDSWTLDILPYYQKVDIKNFSNNGYSNEGLFSDTKQGVNVKNKIDYGSGNFIFGYDYVLNKGDRGMHITVSTPRMTMNQDIDIALKKKTHAAYFYETHDFNDFFGLSGGARYEWAKFDSTRVSTTKMRMGMINNVSGGDEIKSKRDINNYSFEITPNFRYSNSGNVYAKFERGYISPSPSSLTDKTQTGEYKTNNLQSETYQTYEIGLKDEIFGSHVSATVYLTDTKDEIVNEMHGSGMGAANQWWRYYNVGKTRRYGLELNAKQYIFDKLSLSQSYSYVNTEIKESDDANSIGKEVPYVSNHTFVFGATYEPINNLKIFSDIKYYSKQKDANYDTIGAKTIVDAGLNYKFANGLMLGAGVKNLFNKKYYLYESKSLDSYAPANERNFYAEFKFDF
ncbi:MAG: TonB-dependent receptor [Campylobacter sp.]|nr:TonB-dependent receptor [Campylobacter sp.]